MCSGCQVTALTDRVGLGTAVNDAGKSLSVPKHKRETLKDGTWCQEHVTIEVCHQRWGRCCAPEAQQSAMKPNELVEGPGCNVDALNFRVMFL